MITRVAFSQRDCEISVVNHLLTLDKIPPFFLYRDDNLTKKGMKND